MLIFFAVENWLSFRDRVEFSMAKSKERQHIERLPYLDKYKIHILPIAAIYGGNASGKTNLFHALNFGRRLVIRGTQPDQEEIPVQPFLLDTDCQEKPCCFEFEILSDEDICYRFGFAVTRKQVIKEYLTEISKQNERCLYHRELDKMEWHPKYKNDKFLSYVFQGTRKNQLFLTNSISQKVEFFRDVYNWFKNNLVLIAPDTRFNYSVLLDEKRPVYNRMKDVLPLLDTGISDLGSKESEIENTFFFPEELKIRLQEEMPENISTQVIGPKNKRFVITKEKGKLKAKELIAYHSDIQGNKIAFDISQESDGTQRVIDLLPAFLNLTKDNPKKVYIIDELNRSLHPLLSRQLLESYLNTCLPQSRCQLLFTTHDIFLMEQSILRRDEMWLLERNNHGVSSLFSLSDYHKVRYDKDIRKSYLQGRFGGIPKFLLSGMLDSIDYKEEGHHDT